MSPLERFRKTQSLEKFPPMIVTNRVNVSYLSGFTGSNALLLITPDTATLFTDSRYTIQASEECPGFHVETVTVRLLEAAAEEINRLGYSEVGFEEEHITVREHGFFIEKLENVRPVPLRGIVENLRAVKDEIEVEAIRAAAQLVDQAYEHILTVIKPGISELDIAVEIDYFIRRHGAREGFDTIVASGYRAALPHAQPTTKTVSPGEMVKMDFGVGLNGYNSDLTRVVAVGSVDETQRRIYNTVLSAQLAGIAAIHPGAVAKEVDAVARDLITDAGYGENFGHSLGHSLGREVHDGLSLSTRSETVLESGMVFTVEPGIYIEGWGGVRIEDDVLVTESGHEVLTHAPKELQVLG